MMRRREFLSRLRTRMQQLDITQRELARRLEQSPAAVSDWFSKSSLPSGEVMMRMPAALNVSGHWLLTGIGSPTPAGQEVEIVFQRGELAGMCAARDQLNEMIASRQKRPATDSARDVANRLHESESARDGKTRRPVARRRRA